MIIIPSKYRRITGDQDLLRRQIRAYKEMDSDAVARFTRYLISAVALISRDIRLLRIGLVAALPSKVCKESPASESIRQIVSLSKKGVIASAFGCEIEDKR